MTASDRESAPTRETIALSKREAAEILGISVRTIERLIALKHLEVHRLGRRVLIRRVALEGCCGEIIRRELLDSGSARWRTGKDRLFARALLW